jgi:hypothetical protein
MWSAISRQSSLVKVQRHADSHPDDWLNSVNATERTTGWLSKTAYSPSGNASTDTAYSRSWPRRIFTASASRLCNLLQRIPLKDVRILAHLPGLAARVEISRVHAITRSKRAKSLLRSSPCCSHGPFRRPLLQRIHHPVHLRRGGLSAQIPARRVATARRVMATLRLASSLGRAWPILAPALT